jgi:ribosomal protein S18 acetylase RimI-like enzyme
LQKKLFQIYVKPCSLPEGWPVNDPAAIRLIRPADESRVRDICFATALYGQPMHSVIADRMWMTDVLLDYHFTMEPESLLVAEVGGVVVGYLAGCSDPRRQQQWFMRKKIWTLLARAIQSRQILNARSWKLLRASAQPFWYIRHRLHQYVHAYPAFLHINLDVSWQGRGVGKRLLDEFLTMLRERRILGVHISTGTTAGRVFFSKHEFLLLGAFPIKGVMGIPPGMQCLMGRVL